MDTVSIIPQKARCKPLTAPDRQIMKNCPPKNDGHKHQGIGIKGFFAGTLFCLMCFAVLFAGFWFNIGNLKSKAIVCLKLDVAEFEYLEKQKGELAKIEASLADQQKQLDIDQQNLSQNSLELEKSQAENASKAAELEAISAKLTDQKDSLESIIGIYEAMDPVQAAKILIASQNQAEQKIILKNLNRSRLSLILSEMTPAQASEMLEMISGSVSEGD